MPNFLDVILPIPVERLFTYRITAQQVPAIQPGMRVAVPFGKSKIYTAITFRAHQIPPTGYEAKEIHEVLDETPIIGLLQLKHWQWIAEYYMCTLGEVVRAGTPSMLLLESETQIMQGQIGGIEESELTDNEFLVVEALHHQSSIQINDVIQITGKKHVLPLINRLANKGVIKLKERIHEKYRPKQVKYIRIHADHDSDKALESLVLNLERAPKQSQAVLSYFNLKGKNNKPLKVSDLEKESGVSKAVIKALVEKSIFEVFEIRTDRVIFEANEKTVDDLQLNTLQATALKDIQTSFERGKACLLHGVTSSGKTEVYIKLIQSALASGKQILYLLPEIALTSQLINRLKAFFGNQVAVYHSRYSQNERVEVWQNVLQGNDKARIVLGARSALFLPFSDLGLVIVDEEHEQSFKQFDPAPRYHARDAAIYLARLHQANCVLGSATPSIESYTNVKKGKYGLAEIPRRYGHVMMPEIELVDIKQAHRKKRMQGHFSERLLNGIQKTLEQGEQVILFQNRRGFAPVIECTTCGNSPQCPNCDVSLTFHQYHQQLRCHYCGFHIPMLRNCQACGNTTLDAKGFGTEQVQEELKQLLPEVEVGRMDLDTTRRKYAHEKLITAFEAQEMDILVGTQMITKGLDFRNVGLVGIMNADTLLNFPDYRAHERSFQLLVQVAGRAGRAKKRGKVL
ncbi:MAG: primosomal protein N', partial [Bacteroidota bacterium]